MTFYDPADEVFEPQEPPRRTPLIVQILTIVGFTAFAIPISIIAMGMFGVLGLILAAFLAWQWLRIVGMGASTSVSEAVERLKPHVDGAAPRTSGNSSFDAYRTELINRLEQEQQSFEGFLSRLRDAKDRGEFDRFMDEREHESRKIQDAEAA